MPGSRGRLTGAPSGSPAAKCLGTSSAATMPGASPDGPPVTTSNMVRASALSGCSAEPAEPRKGPSRQAPRTPGPPPRRWRGGPRARCRDAERYGRSVRDLAADLGPHREDPMDLPGSLDRRSRRATPTRSRVIGTGPASAEETAAQWVRRQRTQLAAGFGPTRKARDAPEARPLTRSATRSSDAASAAGGLRAASRVARRFGSKTAAGRRVSARWTLAEALPRPRDWCGASRRQPAVRFGAPPATGGRPRRPRV